MKTIRPTRMTLRRSVIAVHTGSEFAANLPPNLIYNDEKLAQIACKVLTRRADHTVSAEDGTKTLGQIGVTNLERRLIKADSNAVLEALHAPGRFSIPEMEAISSVMSFITLFISKGQQNGGPM